MEGLGLLLLAGLVVMYYARTSPEERMQAAKHRHEMNNRILGGGFNVLGFFLKRLK